MAEYSWMTAVGAHWENVEADYNAKWTSMAYLDGPGYTVMDRIEAKLDLHQKYFSRSSSHGVVNSPKEISTQAIESHLTSSVAESNQQSNLRIAECAREIRESCARILKLLQEEIDASESADAANSLKETGQQQCQLQEVIDASAVHKGSLLTAYKGELVTDSTIVALDCKLPPLYDVQREEVEASLEEITTKYHQTLERVNFKRVIVNPFRIGLMLTCLSCVRRNVSAQSLLLKPLNWMHGTVAHPPPPPEPPDLHCCVDSTVRYSPTHVYRAVQTCCMEIAQIINDEMLNLLVISLNSLLWSNSTTSLTGMIYLVKKDKDGNGLETSSQDSVAMTKSSGYSVLNGETFTTLEIVKGKYVLTRMLHAPPWSGIEDYSFLFSLNVLGKSVKFFQIMVVVNIVGCTLVFNYDIFCWSQCFFPLIGNQKLETHQYIGDHKIFIGWREHELLLQFPYHDSENYETKLIQLLKNLRVGYMSFVECVIALEVFVGIELLITAMDFRKGQHHEPFLVCQRALIVLSKHKGETHAWSQWRNQEYWCRIELHIIDVVMARNIQSVTAFNYSYAIYISIIKAYMLFHGKDSLELGGNCQYVTITKQYDIYFNFTAAIQYATLKLLSSLFRIEKIAVGRGMWNFIKSSNGYELSSAWALWMFAVFSKGHVKELNVYRHANDMWQKLGVQWRKFGCSSRNLSPLLSILTSTMTINPCFVSHWHTPDTVDEAKWSYIESLIVYCNEWGIHNHLVFNLIFSAAVLSCCSHTSNLIVEGSFWDALQFDRMKTFAWYNLASVVNAIAIKKPHVIIWYDVNLLNTEYFAPFTLPPRDDQTPILVFLIFGDTQFYQWDPGIICHYHPTIS